MVAKIGAIPIIQNQKIVIGAPTGRLGSIFGSIVGTKDGL